MANAAAKLGLAGRADLRHWDGIPRDGELRRRSEVDEQVRLGEIGQVSLPVADVERSVAWYRDVLGLPTSTRSGRSRSSTAPEPACS